MRIQLLSLWRRHSFTSHSALSLMLLAIVVPLAAATRAAAQAGPSAAAAKPRVRDLGLPIGGSPGRLDARFLHVDGSHWMGAEWSHRHLPAPGTRLRKGDGN